MIKSDNDVKNSYSSVWPEVPATVKLFCKEQGRHLQCFPNLILKTFFYILPQVLRVLHMFPNRNKSSQLLPNTPFASISECLVS